MKKQISEMNKSIFISYRRKSSFWFAKSIFDKLKSFGYDVFFDIARINNGEFAEIIISQIWARPHFIIILDEGTLERTVNEDDWLRKEITVAIMANRNIIPITTESFYLESNKKYFVGSLKKVLDFQFLESSRVYFDAFINKLIERLEGGELTEIELKVIPAYEQKLSNVFINKVEINLKQIESTYNEQDTSIPERSFDISDLYKDLDLVVAYIDLSGKIDCKKEDSIIALSNGKDFSLKIPPEEKISLINSNKKSHPKRSIKWLNLSAFAFFIVEVLKNSTRKTDYFFIDNEYYGNEKELKSLVMNNIKKSGLRIKSSQIRIRDLDKNNTAHEYAIKVKRGKLIPDKVFCFVKED
ncbi:MAG TPA: toll/interleukin-1 receptor domain-containing protein [Pelolinea sp.]|nr:toll/interleukin-1 receptor domain-containing protein [Pelolinea sp.]